MAPLRALLRIGKRSVSQLCGNSASFRGVDSKSENNLAKLLSVFQSAAGSSEAKRERHGAFEYWGR